MKVNILFENEDRMAIMKAMQDSRFSKMRDSLSREDIALLVRMVKLQDRKQNPRKGISDDALETLQTLGLADKLGPTMAARSFLRWLINNPSREQQYHDKRTDADIALARGQLKRDNDWVDPRQIKARKVIKSLSDTEKDIFRKLYNRYFNERTRNLAMNWGAVPPADKAAMQRYGIIDDNGDLTEFGEFAINYYTAFKNDPDGLDRVSRARRVGNYGDAMRRRQARLKKVT